MATAKINAGQQRRLAKELRDIRNNGIRCFRLLQVEDVTWHGLIVPDKAPYNKGAFKIEINFPAEYPFKSPEVTFKTKIYHPKISKEGCICLPVICHDKGAWSPSMNVTEVVQAIVDLLNDSKPENSPWAAHYPFEYSTEEKFFKNAEEFRDIF